MAGMARNAGFLLCVLVLILPVCSGDDKCDLDKIKYQANFQEEKYLGLWYEARFYSGKNWTTPDVRIDYTHYHYKKPDDTALYIDEDFRTGRTGTCEARTFKYDPTETPGRYVRRNQHFFVVRTDYDNYALDLVCWSHVNGTCVGSFANVWSRRKTLSPDYIRIIEEEVTQLCAPTVYHNITNDNVCRPVSLSSTAVPSFGLVVVIATWRLVVE